jgi:hypothetical protein
MSEAEFQSRVRLEVYRQFLERGSCPSKSAIAQSLGAPLDDVVEAFSKLARAHMLVLQPETGEVLMANPLSAVPTPFLVETQHPAGTRNWYGNCIWDAFGIISMLETNGRVLTSCGCCGEQMSVAVKDRRPFPQPAGTVHFAIPARHWWDDIVFN